MENEIMVIDPGCAVLKAGFAGESAPRCVLPSLVGTPKYVGAMRGVGRKDAYVGDEAQTKRGVLHVDAPMHDGAVRDWAAMERLLATTFTNELRTQPDEVKGVLVTECPLNPREHRARFAELLFETHKAHNAYFCVQGILSLYATGHTTGLVLSIGDGVTYTTPVFEGNILPHAVQRTQVAGRHVTEHFCKMLNAKGIRAFTSSAELQLAREIKEQLAYVATDYAGEVKRALDTPDEVARDFLLPDGRWLTVGRERFTCTEVLFKPAFFLGYETGSVADVVADSINRCGIDLRKGFYSNVQLAGATTLFDGMRERVQSELEALAPPNMRVRVTAPKTRAHCAWLGGSIFAKAALEPWHRIWIDRDEYKESGVSALFRKCY